ncbi:ribonuclease H-like domain-containing protein [Gymnopilus junonius]|uniref:Ribonuclease H-like domain-containing protein n=1 Tax=Gymnopilus junonius TaxID=109634 RepID=A0A9P5NJ13_GYMJU|nr:ribonuclease H-like domain-containing protein [Gymnopilus junonius]
MGKGPLWNHFIKGAKQNGSHQRAHCRGCIEAERPDGAAIELDDDGKPKLSMESWVIEGKSRLTRIGNNPCLNASREARNMAKELQKKAGKREDSQPKKRKLLTKVEASLKQSKLQVFHGIQVPFSGEQAKILFYLFHATAGDVIPTHQQVSGRLLDDANSVVTKLLKEALRGKYAVMASDGWKDESHNSISSVNLTVGGKTYLIDLILATAHRKDGEAMCQAFMEMIDKAEDIYGVRVIGFCCDNDGGSQRGRKDLVLKCKWLFGPPCCAHQFQLILGDYFEENEEAAEVAEDAMDLIGWVLNHGRVHSVFNEVLAFLVANMTWWNTHFIAFDHLTDLKDPMRHAVISRRGDIIAAQVGAEKNRQKKQKLEDDAIIHCDCIDDGAFWRCLQSVVDDLEPTCFGLNMNQSDATHADQALLTFAGIFLYFQKHSKPTIAAGMLKRIEKRWKALDQLMFILALILNPFEGLTHFGDNAGASPLTLNSILIKMYKCVNSRPPKIPLPEDEEVLHMTMQAAKEKEVSEAFLKYMALRGPFEDWKKNRETFRDVHGDDPLAMWETYLSIPSTSELANFAILLLSMSVNQAGLERNFSDLKIKKTWLRNQLKLPKLEKMAKVGAEIHASHKEEGLVEDHAKRQNHKKLKLLELLAVPRYADLVEDVDKASMLVKSRQGWHKEMSKWVQKEREQDSEAEDNNQLANAVYGCAWSKWLPRSLDLLFGGHKETDVDVQLRRVCRRQGYTEEAHLMELLADEEADEERIPDDSELEGSGDDFDG